MQHTRMGRGLKRACTAGLMLGLCLLFTGSAAAAEYVVNGGFESPAIGRDIVRYSQGENLDGWNIDSGNIELIASDVWPGHSGDQSIDLSGVTTGAISQTIATVPGKTYLLSFWVSGNWSGAPTVKSMAVSFGGTTLPTQTFDTTDRYAQNMGWQLRQFAVTATGSSTVLQFASLDDSDAGMALDDISLTDADTTPPVLAQQPVGTIGASNGLAYIPVLITDSGSGVKKVQLTANSTNCHLEYPLGTRVFPAGTPRPQTLELPNATGAVTVYVVKDANSSARVEVRAWDGVNNTALLDPVVANLELKRSRVLTRTFKGIPENEKYVTIQNDTPGLTGVSIWINGRLAINERLIDGQTLELDASRWLRRATGNVVRVLASGPKGAKAILTISDTPTTGTPDGLSSTGRKLNVEFAP